jgi:hypothetical protein
MAINNNGWTLFIAEIDKTYNVPFDVWGHILGFDSNVILRFFIRSKQIVDTSFLCNIPKIVHTDWGLHCVNMKFGYNLCKSYELMYRKYVDIWGDKQIFSVNYHEVYLDSWNIWHKKGIVLYM